MLSRRHLRIKVFQALFAQAHNLEQSLTVGESNLRKSIEDIYRLYLFDLVALTEMVAIAERQMERNRQKLLAGEADLKPNRHFVDNSFIAALREDPGFQKACAAHHVVFDESLDLLRGIFKNFSESEAYAQYMQASEPSALADRKIIKVLYGQFMVGHENLEALYEAQNMHWADDLDAAQAMVVKSLSRFPEKKGEGLLVPLLKTDDDLDFALKLFRETRKRGKEYDERIAAQAVHWESDRLATTDLILMRMALTEMVIFRQIPVKVSLNEYIELAKEYSTQRSGQFINGVLDALRAEMMESGEIKKIGKGLL